MFCLDCNALEETCPSCATMDLAGCCPCCGGDTQSAFGQECDDCYVAAQPGDAALDLDDDEAVDAALERVQLREW